MYKWVAVNKGRKLHPRFCELVNNLAKYDFTYQGVRNLACFVFLKHPFSDSLFRLITDEVLDNADSKKNN